MLLTGLHMLALDAKGRLSVPARYRNDLEDQAHNRLVITLQPQRKALWIFPEPEYEEAAREVRKLSDFEPSELAFKRLFIGHAMHMDIDGSGRVLIPPVLRAQIGMDKKVALMGMTNKFELWDEGSWQEMQKGLYLPEDGAGISDRLKGLSI